MRARIPDSIVSGGGHAGRLDHLPEFGIFLQGLVLTCGQTGAKQKILERVAAENAVDNDAQFVALEIYAVISNAKTVEGLAGALQMAEVMKITFQHFARKAAKFAEDLELQFPGHAAQFGGARGIKNNLELHGQRLPRDNPGGNRNIFGNISEIRQ